MAIWLRGRKRKKSGGMIAKFRKKRKCEIGREKREASIGTHKRQIFRTRGSNRKIRILRAEFANVLDPKTKKSKKAKIITVVENKANPHYVRRNIITKGAVIQTDLGKAVVLSRPGQCGIINCLLCDTEVNVKPPQE